MPHVCYDEKQERTVQLRIPFSRRTQYCSRNNSVCYPWIMYLWICESCLQPRRALEWHPFMMPSGTSTTGTTGTTGSTSNIAQRSRERRRVVWSIQNWKTLHSCTSRSHRSLIALECCAIGGLRRAMTEWQEWQKHEFLAMSLCNPLSVIQNINGHFTHV